MKQQVNKQWLVYQCNIILDWLNDNGLSCTDKMFSEKIQLLEFYKFKINRLKLTNKTTIAL